MKPVNVKIPTLAKLAEMFHDVRICAVNNGTYANFGNNSEIDLEDIGKTISLSFCAEECWTSCVDDNSFTSINTDDLRVLFPKRKFKSPRRNVKVGCNSVCINNHSQLVSGVHVLTEEEITGVEELIATWRQMKKPSEQS